MAHEDMTQPPENVEAKPQPSPADKKRNNEWLARISACKTYRKKLIQNWTINVDYRRGKPFASQTDEDRVVVNLDWSLTKAKQASLFSQIPRVNVTHPPQSVATGPWLYSFEQRLNDTLVMAGIESAMDETIVDCINAAGVGAVLVAREAITVDKEVPAIDLSMYPPEVAETMMLPDGTPVPMETVPETLDSRYVVSRISPADLLFPINFTGSDFDQAPWLGRSGRMTWPAAQQRFKLSDAEKDKVLGEDRTYLDRLTHDIDKDKTTADELVSFDEIFYKESEFTVGAQRFAAIHHLIFITGKDEPVVDEPWKGQQETEVLIGAQKFPIRVLTLTYLTDEAIPPSDSAIGRPQVNEINKGRTQMILQRERSIPLRTVNVNLMDPAVLQSLMRGTWQNIIPVQSNAEVIREVARAHMPQENYIFDRIAKADLGEEWQLGTNQMGTGGGVETAGEAEVIQQGFTTRIGRERAKVSKFFVSIAEVLGGLLCLFEDPASFGEGFDPVMSKSLAYSILADSTVLVDSQQRLARLKEFVNFSAKSGWMDIEPVLREIAQLSGLDPNTVVKPPPPKPPVEPNISLRLTGTEDMLQPLTLAFLMKSGQAPEPELIEQAKQLIQLSVTPPPNAMPPAPPPIDPETGMPMEMPAGPPPGGAMPLPPTPTMPGMMNEAVPPPMPPPPAIGMANPKWSILNSLNKRAEEE